MNRALKCISILSILTMLVSCDVFFATRDGRWNVLDPENELETFKPSLDGYVENGAGWVDDAELWVEPGKKIILMRFNTSNFPDAVAASYLLLFMAPPVGSGSQLRVHRIMKSWDSNITYAIANEGGVFYDDMNAVTVDMPAGGDEEIFVPLTEIFSGDKGKLTNGIIIYSEGSVVAYQASESTSGPLLMLEPD